MDNATWATRLATRRQDGRLVESGQAVNQFFRAEEMQKRSAGPIGDPLREQFSARDILESSHEQTPLASRSRLAAEKT
jgi:hypothetical protein